MYLSMFPFIILFKGRDPNILLQPVILENNSLFVWIQIEAVDLLKSESMKDAILCWALSFELFNIEIPNEMKLLPMKILN